MMCRPGFRRQDLDHRSPNYIRAAKGGVSNKQIAIMACMIEGQEPRSFDESWKIVMHYMDERRARRTAETHLPASNEAAPERTQETDEL
jgi:hypothetical protein